MAELLQLADSINRVDAKLVAAIDESHMDAALIVATVLGKLFVELTALPNLVVVVVIERDF